MAILGCFYIAVALNESSNVKGRDFHSAFVVAKDENKRSSRMHCCMIGGCDGVFSAVTRSNDERLKGRGVKQFSNSGDHAEDFNRRCSTLNHQLLNAAARAPLR